MTERDRVELLDHLADEFGDFGRSAAGFLVTAQNLLHGGDSEQQPRLAEVVAYCMREALKRILDSVESPQPGRWRSASRRVTAAKEKLDLAARAGNDEGEALDDLLEAVDALEEFHGEAGLHERRLIAVLVARTGGVPLEAQQEIVLQYQGLINELDSAVHGRTELEWVRRALDRTLQLLRQLFSPPDARLAELDELAAIDQPTAEDAERLRGAVSATSHLEYFFGRVVTARWLDLLADASLVTPPSAQAPWPVFRLIETLVGQGEQEEVDEIGRWLERAYGRWGDDSLRAAFLARAAVDLGPTGYSLLVRILADHQQDRTVCHTAEWGIRDADPSSPVVAEVADHLLNPESGLGRSQSAHSDHGILRMLIDGLTTDNASSRLQLLAFKLQSVEGSDGARQLALQRAGSISDEDHLSDDYFTAMLDGFVKSLGRSIDLGLGVDIALSATEMLGDELSSRLRVWTLASARDATVEACIWEISAGASSRRPHGDDLRLIDRIVAEASVDLYTDDWRAALGPPPSPEGLAAALGDDSVDERWLRGREWAAILPEQCVGEWRTASSLLAAAYGPFERDVLEHRPQVWSGTARSPMSVDEIAHLGPDEAAAAIARWRPDPSEWLVGARELARALEDAVKRDPRPWLRSPVALVGDLREPIYISHYFRAVASVDEDLAVAAEQLVDAVVFSRSHPWEPAVLGREDWDYDPDWRAADEQGVAVLRKLAEGDSGFGANTDRAWSAVLEAARNRSEGSALGSSRDDPLETAINRSCTKGLEAALSLMGFEFRSGAPVCQEGLDLLGEGLRLPGWDGAEHRAIIASRLVFLLHIVPDWVEDHAELIVGDDAPEDLGQLSVDMAVKWGRPHRWLLERAREAVLDAVGRGVENALRAIAVGMLWEVPGYEPATLVDRLSRMSTTLISDAGRVLGRMLRGGDVMDDHLRLGVEFWKEALARTDGAGAYGFGWWADVERLGQAQWESLTLACARRAGGRLGHAHAVAERAAGDVSVDGLGILNQLVRGDIDEWDRIRIMDSAAAALREAKDRGLTDFDHFRQLRTTLIERGRFDVREI